MLIKYVGSVTQLCPTLCDPRTIVHKVSFCSQSHPFTSNHGEHYSFVFSRCHLNSTKEYAALLCLWLLSFRIMQLRSISVYKYQ